MNEGVVFVKLWGIRDIAGLRMGEIVNVYTILEEKTRREEGENLDIHVRIVLIFKG
jgi:hypothetical protein